MGLWSSHLGPLGDTSKGAAGVKINVGKENQSPSGQTDSAKGIIYKPEMSKPRQEGVDRDCLHSIRGVVTFCE